MAQLKAIVIPMVQEFYANAPDYTDFKVFVHKMQVSFSPKAINAYYSLPNIANDDYHKILDEGTNL